jgi:hypothetical protein
LLSTTIVAPPISDVPAGQSAVAALGLILLNGTCVSDVVSPSLVWVTLEFASWTR